MAQKIFVKTIILAALFILTGLFATSGHALTFTEWDAMTKDQRADFIAETGITIWQWMKENKPPVADCMDEKFSLNKNADTPPAALIELNGKINGVPEKDRGKYRVEALMVNYIVEICPEK